MPSGLLWCKNNLGASAPEEIGYYYSWGNVDGHYGDSGYSWSQEEYNNTTGASIDHDLTAAEDAASQELGVKYRIPRLEDYEELVENCELSIITIGPMRLIKFTSTINGKDISIPLAGVMNGQVHNNLGLHLFCWCREFVSITQAKLFDVSNELVVTYSNTARRLGLTIRAVREP